MLDLSEWTIFNPVTIQIYGTVYLMKIGEEFRALPLDEEGVIIDLTRTKYIRESEVETSQGKIKRKKVTKKVIRNLYSMQEGACFYCFQNLEAYHCDHIRPITLGGSSKLENLCLCCDICNLIKSDKCFATISDIREYISDVKKSRKPKIC